MRKIKVARTRKVQTLFSERTVNRVRDDEDPDFDTEDQSVGPQGNMTRASRDYTLNVLKKKGIIEPPNYTKQ